MTTYRGGIPCGTPGTFSAPGADTGTPGLRADALVDGRDFRDDGCNLHSKCLTCPFAKCQYDLDGESIYVLQRAGRNLAIQEARADGEDVGLIAMRFGLSVRTVFRALEK